MLVVRELGARAGGRELFRGVNFELGPGELLAVTGPSGCGKTTLLRAVAGLAVGASGEVTLEGKSSAELGVRRFRSQVALVPQSPPQLSGSLGDYVRKVAGLSVNQARSSGADLRGRLEQRLEMLALRREFLDRPFAEFSGGERARLYLALVLSTEPAVLLLDEPTAALDEASSRAVEEQLLGRTGVLVSHSPALIARLGARQLELPFSPELEG